MEILINVLNKSLKQIDIIDSYSSLIWSMRFYLDGDFELCVSVNEKNIESLQEGHYITRDDDSNVGIIEKIKIIADETGNEKMIVSGGFLPTILKRRIIENQTVINDTISNAIKKLLNENVIAPSNDKRKISNIAYVDNYIPTRIDAQYTGKNLLEVIEGLCETYHVGFKGYLDDGSRICFTLFEGVDRSYNQRSVPHAIFSDEYDNLISSEYTIVYADQITDALVAGEGEGVDRKTLWVSNGEHSGIDRYETYVDQRNLSSNDGEISMVEYDKQLTEAGMEVITPTIGIFNGTVLFDNLEFRKDVNIGDVCVVENRIWMMYMNTRLIEMIESVDETGKYTLNPTFGI